MSEPNAEPNDIPAKGLAGLTTGCSQIPRLRDAYCLHACAFRRRNASHAVRTTTLEFQAMKINFDPFSWKKTRHGRYARPATERLS